MTADEGTATPAEPPRTIREFEHALRSLLGYSKAEARAIASSGFRAAQSADAAAADEEQAELDELASLLAARAATIKGH